MKHNTFYYMYADLRDRLKLLRFKAAWRKKNPHNLTEACNIWPIDKVTVGKYTYGLLNCAFFGTAEGDERITIGNNCSIAKDTIF